MESEELNKLSRLIAKKFPSLPINAEWNIAKFISEEGYTRSEPTGLRRLDKNCIGMIKTIIDSYSNRMDRTNLKIANSIYERLNQILIPSIPSMEEIYKVLLNNFEPPTYWSDGMGKKMAQAIHDMIEGKNKEPK